ncbi:unnamed protein product [Symbiodinium sp. CCMP2592]|nr:unnamed protein product [Symbiodinium sp. CCMP2592]
MEKYEADNCSGPMYDFDLDASGECLFQNNERYTCNATGILYEKFNGSNSDCSSAFDWGDFFPFNTCVRGYNYTECVDLPAVTLEMFADAACTTKMADNIVPLVDCRTPDDRASSKTELVDGSFMYSAYSSSDCMGNTVGNITVPCGGNCTSGMGQYAKNNNACPSSTESTTASTTTTTMDANVSTTSATSATSILGVFCATAGILIRLL